QEAEEEAPSTRPPAAAHEAEARGLAGAEADRAAREAGGRPWAPSGAPGDGRLLGVRQDDRRPRRPRQDPPAVQEGHPSEHEVPRARRDERGEGRRPRQDRRDQAGLAPEALAPAGDREGSEVTEGRA